MSAVLARVARRFIALKVCTICGKIDHEREDCPHRWDLHAGERAA